MSRWEPGRAAPASRYSLPAFFQGLKRGLQDKCPCCGEGHVFLPGLRNWLKVVPECAHCGAPLGLLRSDDAPPYFTILLVGHLLVPFILWTEQLWEPPIWVHMSIWLPLFTIVCVLALRPIKGAVVGWMCALGFDSGEHLHQPLPGTRGSDA